MTQLEQVLPEAGDGTFAVDPGRRISHWSPACERLLGISARAALGQPCGEVVRGCDAAGRRYCGPRCAPGELVRGGAALPPFPLWLEGADGAARQLWLSVFLVPAPIPERWTVVHVLQSKRRALFAGRADAPGGNAASCGTLTPRERQILGMLAQGHCVAEISRTFSLSPVTVRNHVQHLVGKLGLHSQLEAVAYAYRNRLV